MRLDIHYHFYLDEYDTFSLQLCPDTVDTLLTAGEQLEQIIPASLFIYLRYST